MQSMLLCQFIEFSEIIILLRIKLLKEVYLRIKKKRSISGSMFTHDFFLVFI